MPALTNQYIIGPPLQEAFIGKDTGLPLAGGFVYFFMDDARTVPKPVYELTGAPPNYTLTALPNPIVLSSVGTMADGSGNDIVVYYYPFDVTGIIAQPYYIVVTDSNGNPQFTRENWPGVSEGGAPPIGSSPFQMQNQIANPQFTRQLINQNVATTYTVSGATDTVFAFAPDWDFVISGTGTVTVEIEAQAGNSNIPTSPPYTLNVIVSGGITGCFLTQTFNSNSGLWSSTLDQEIFLSTSIVASNGNAGSVGLNMFYDASSGLGSPINILSVAVNSSSYQEYTGGSTSAIPLSNDTNLGSTGFVTVYIAFPSSCNINISSVQVIPVLDEDVVETILYDVNSSNRDQALMGDYYIPRLSFKPIPSLLIGWDFPLNPAQRGSTQSMTTTPAYMWDQTICASASGTNAVSAGTGRDNFRVATGNANSAFYMLQYLSGSQVKKLLGTTLSSNVNAAVFGTSDTVTVGVHLYRGSSSAIIPTLPTTIGTIATNGTFTLTASNWTEIPRSNIPSAQATLKLAVVDSDINSGVDYGFSGWEVIDNTGLEDTAYFAIVVTYAYTLSGTAIVIESTSLVPGDIPTRPAPQTYDEVLRECRYYYEQSYVSGTVPGTITTVGQLTMPFAFVLNSNQYILMATSFTLPYQTKRAVPTVAFYAPDSATPAQIQASFIRNGANNAGTNTPCHIAMSNYSVSSQSVDRIYMLSGTSAPSGISTISISSNLAAEGIAYMHYTADARLGIV